MSSLAVAAPRQPDPEAQCAALGKLAWPAADLPGPAQQATLAGCDAPALYYGIRQPRDFARARHCALTPGDQDDVFGKKPGVLMMLYANGQGVARNLQLAKKAACAAGGAGAELSGRLYHLDLMAPGESMAGQSIDVCDDATSGLMMGYCASLGSARRDVKREQDMSAIAARLTAPQRTAFTRLQAQAEKFVTARGRNEVDLSGTARAMFMTQAEDEQKDAFLAALTAFERGAVPRFSTAQDTDFDRELNTVYQQLRRLPVSAEGEGSTVKMAGIQATQRIWLAYRDAWVEFGKLRYPAVPAHAWRAYFTQQRTAMLKALLEELG